MKIEWLYNKFNGICHYCQNKIGIEEATREHRTPNSIFAKGEFKNSQRRGGGGTRGRAKDIVLACRWCNLNKGNQSEEEFMEWIKKHPFYVKNILL